MEASMMFRRIGAVLMVIFLLGVLQPVAARPEYLVKFQADPFRRPEVDGCVTCHVNPAGGGARNDFGTAFQAASHEITPLLRASFPQQFKFETAKLPDGSAFLLSDPQSKFVVLERANERVLINLAEVSAPKTTPVPLPNNRMGFFVTSSGLEQGGKIGGLAGADRYCQDLAKAAGAGDRTWRAYLSTSFQGKPAVNAGDRIGSGPWYNAKGVLFGRGPVDLHTSGRVRPDVVLTEKGEMPSPVGDGRVDVLTGTLPNGTAAVGQNCDNWTSAGEFEAMAGDPASSWSSGRVISCSPASAEKLVTARLYCFAAK
jgi:hypothetical protein